MPWFEQNVFGFDVAMITNNYKYLFDLRKL